MCLAHEVAEPWGRVFKVVGVGCGADPPPDLCVGDERLVATCKKPSDLGSGCFAWVSMSNTDSEVGSSGRLHNAFKLRFR